MTADFRAIKAELGFAKNEAWPSKDVFTLTLAGGAMVAEGAVGNLLMPGVVDDAGLVQRYCTVPGLNADLA